MVSQSRRVQNRFRSLIELAEQRLRDGEHGPNLNALVDEMRGLAAASDAVNDQMCEDDELALRFDRVVAKWKAAA